ncbi:SDR family oxidoreductase [Aurantimonas endophytica]|uniref:3-oxoacyl-[acyl-carrier protein] reductase n=1 Tax=Aurantimonas endophytica TaxID=1522175 RepID=A0A7W6HFV9_9HYPH|nr:SDR family oxidoreductase [Aurantimonas endophytica]MBB4004372.1 3-oxoacyl-[acyl-carrier protein] reductase [Aurantimonas endophytica]MCO6405210.1 SDR family oxidoreductase [Aurantimonas endophytica]
MDLGLTGKRALVLASSRGLGQGIAEALAAEGANVLLCGRSSEKLAANCEAINARGAGKADYVTADLAAPDFAAMLHQAALDKLGGIDILVNNTGGPPPGGAIGMDVSVLDAQFQMMVHQVIDLTNRVLPSMREAGWGRILTVASSGVVQPIPNLALSNTLRSALVGWSKSLANEVAADGVSVNMLLPGRIHTERTDELDDANSKKTGKSVAEVRDAALAAIPAKRYGDVKEFAAVAAFLVSGPASYITGSVVRCDGGAVRSV